MLIAIDKQTAITTSGERGSMDIGQFIKEYCNQMLNEEYVKNNPNFERLEYRQSVATKMVQAIKADKGRHDYMKYNDAMRRAARKLGIKKTRELKEFLRSSV